MSMESPGSLVRDSCFDGGETMKVKLSRIIHLTHFYLIRPNTYIFHPQSKIVLDLICLLCLTTWSVVLDNKIILEITEQ